MFALLLIPLIGVAALAIEVGNASMQKRQLQHAADSAALAAAINNDATVDSGATLPRYALEAQAAAAKYTTQFQSSVTSTTTTKVDCPGATAGTNSCYQVVVSTTLPMYLSRIVGLQSISPAAMAQATTGGKQNDCMISTFNKDTITSSGGKGDGIYLTGTSDFGNCYAATTKQTPPLPSGPVECSGSAVKFAGISSAGGIKSCSATDKNSTGWNDESTYDTKIKDDLKSPNVQPKDVTCSSSIMSLTWMNNPSNSKERYARLCSSSALNNTLPKVKGSPGVSVVKITGAATSLDISSTTQSSVLILDGVGVDVNGKSLTGTKTDSTTAPHTGTTIVATNTGGGPSSSLGDSSGVIINNTGGKTTLNIVAPTDTSGATFANFAVVGDPTYTGISQLNPTSSSHQVSFSIVGVIYVPYSDVNLDGNNTSSFSVGGTSLACFSVVGNTIQGTGSKINNGAAGGATGGCSSLGYVTPSSIFSQVGLVR